LNPEDVIKLLRYHALELLDLRDKIEACKDYSDEETNEYLFELCTYLIEQLAENRWFASDIIEQYDSGKKPIFMANEFNIQTEKIEDKKISDSLSEPPFDIDFFSKLRDL
jgi:hypothetical protein